LDENGEYQEELDFSIFLAFKVNRGMRFNVSINVDQRSMTINRRRWAAVDFKSLTQARLDALKEIVNIGVGNAVTALSQLIDDKIMMTVPVIDVLPFGELSEASGGGDAYVAGVYLRIAGAISGDILFIMPVQEAKKLASLMLKQQSDDPALSEMECSAVKETGSILTGSFLNALSELTSLSFSYSVPYFCTDIFEAILGSILYNLGAVGDCALFIKTELYHKTEKLVGNFFFLPQANSLDLMFESIGVKN
jgi:chemotaxis protein CheC